MAYYYETAAPDRYNVLKQFAKVNRREMTESETLLWDALRKLRCGYHFRRQHPIGDFIADFICIKKNLVIEVDGEYHNEPTQQQDDQFRTESINNRGYSVIRFTNDEIQTNLPEVLEKIKKYLFNE